MRITHGPIGIFDSGYGGLTVMREIVNALPAYDYVYLGDNARAPYGTRAFDTVYRFSWECVQALFRMNCPLVIVACNTASARALRNLQQINLAQMGTARRVLGVIRPTTEQVGKLTRTQVVGVLGTSGTVSSGSYVVEIKKFFPQIRVFQQACPIWVPLVENNELNNPGSDFFVRRDLHALLHPHPDMDTVILGCTHYPLLLPVIQKHLPSQVQLVSQGSIVAQSLTDYLLRHPEMEMYCTKNKSRAFFTTDSVAQFDQMAGNFYGAGIKSEFITLG